MRGREYVPTYSRAYGYAPPLGWSCAPRHSPTAESYGGACPYSRVTPNPRPQHLNPKPQTPNPNSLNPIPTTQSPNSKPQSPDPKPQTPNPEHETPNSKRQTPNRSPLALNPKLHFPSTTHQKLHVSPACEDGISENEF